MTKYALDTISLERDTEFEFFRGSGPGGQHRNRRETGVRLHHRPSGLIIEATEERSQKRNREVAFSRLLKRLKQLNRPQKRRIPTKPSKAAHRRRIEEKRLQSRKKQARRTPSNTNLPLSEDK